MKFLTLTLHKVFKNDMNTTLSVSKINKKISFREDIPLSEFSLKDDEWNKKRRLTEILSQYLLQFSEFKKWGQKASECAQFLVFKFEINKDTGELILKLSTADFCRFRHCPVCNWRRSMRLKASFYHFIPGYLEENPRSRFIFLTLTVRSPVVHELGETLTEMNKAWQRLSQRKIFRDNVSGFIRATEVTRGAKQRNNAHPHFHVLLQVDESYFTGRNYIKRDTWLELWQEAMRDPNITQVDVRAVKKEIASDNIVNEIMKTFNYSIKEVDFENPDKWLLEYFRQVYRRRFIVAGGSMKPAIKDLRDGEETNEDLINTEEEKQSNDLKEEENLYFGWRNFEFIYRKTYLT